MNSIFLITRTDEIKSEIYIFSLFELFPSVCHSCREVV